ncbi:hypothetical protein YC2023_116576 [Brassica napus]
MVFYLFEIEKEEIMNTTQFLLKGRGGNHNTIYIRTTIVFSLIVTTCPMVTTCFIGSRLALQSTDPNLSHYGTALYGKSLFPSRRSFVGICSQLEADLVALGWAVEAMRHLNLSRVILEFSSTMSPVTLSTSNLPQSLQPHWRKFNRSIAQLEVCKLVLTSLSGNLIASAIADSALHIQHHQSYMSANGPGWLESRIRREAMALV